MAESPLKETYVRALMVIGKPPPKLTTKQVAEKLYDDEAVDTYCRWLDFHEQMERYYMLYVMGFGYRTRTEDWCKGYLEWCNAHQHN